MTEPDVRRYLGGYGPDQQRQELERLWRIEAALRTTRIWLEDLEAESKDEMTQMERDILSLVRTQGLSL